MLLFIFGLKFVCLFFINNSFRNKRLSEGVGSSVQLAQMQAAENALIEKADLFPSFDFRNTYLGIRNGENNEPLTTLNNVIF